jgi:prepilin-type N-terminal cleavage/methylation domain-containing protein
MGTRQSNRRGFTLVELLVVIGIIAVLIAILMTAMRKVRIASVNTVCGSRLHQITLACSAYLVDYKVFPLNYVNDPYQFVYPHDQQSRTMNQLSTYLTKFPDITDATPLGDLPAALQCPWAEMSDSEARKVVGNGNTYWYTGYAYYARLDERVNYIQKGPPPVPQIQNGQLIKPLRHADGKGRRRGVLYGDNLVYFGYLDMWNYTHSVNAAVGVPAGFGFWRTNTRSLHGRHLAWSDGSVEWVNGGEMKLDKSQAVQNASYWDGGLYFWWY